MTDNHCNESRPFRIGDSVKVKGIRSAAVVTAYAAEGVYEVAIGSLRLRCAENQLSGQISPKFNSKVSVVLQGPAHSVPQRIDLHGKSSSEALNEVSKYIDCAILKGFSQVEIVHGIGDGILMNAVHRYLSTMSCVKHFKVHPLNPGVTFVYL